MHKLVQINSVLGYSSIGRIADQIGTLAETKGWKCYYAHGTRYVTRDAQNAIPIGSKSVEYSHYVISLLTGRDGIGSLCATKQLVNKLKKIQPDIVHLHNIHGYYINYKILFEYLSTSNIPVVWTFHDCWPITGHCPYFDSVECLKWKTGCYKCPLQKEYPKSLIFDQSEYNYKQKKKAFCSVKKLTIVPVSNWLANIVKESYLKNADINVIHNGINLDIFKPTVSNLRNSLSISNNKPIVLGVATGWDERKGFSDFIKLAKLNKFNLIMVGDFAIDEVAIPSSIIHIKHTNSQKELAELYSLADVFINPTYSDNFPTTNIESLACGTPVITYNTGGSPEALDINTGIVIPQGDITALTNAIIKIVDSPIPPEICRQRAIQYFDKDLCFDKYIKLYSSILAKV